MSQAMCKDGIIILINGCSCVGKSSVQQALQKISDQHFLRIGIDTFFDQLIEEPDLSDFDRTKKFDQYTKSGEYIRGVHQYIDQEGSRVVPLKIGPAGDRIIHGMHRAIREYAKAGNNLIIDYICYKNSWQQDLAISLQEQTVYLIKAHAPLNIIEKREKLRKTSPEGHARSHYFTVHDGMNYDLEIDTHQLTPEQCAKMILDYIKAKPNPKALKDKL